MEADDNLIEQQEPTKRFVLRKPVRIAILVLLYLAVCAQGMTMTIFNVANTSIRAELRITERTHAIFNFIFHVGEFISIICLMFIMRRADRKSTVLFSVFGTLGLLSLFLFSDSQMVLMPCYFFIGFCVMTMNVYIILWVDQFAMFLFKTAFLSFINLAKAIGVILGLLLNYSFTPAGYKKSFLVESIFLAVIGGVLMSFHSVYFVSDLLLYKGKFGEEKFKFKAKTQKEGGEEDNQSCEGAESIYRYRRSGGSTNEYSVFYILLIFLKNRVYMSGLFASAIMVCSTVGLNNYVMGYINGYFTEPNMDSWRLLKNKLLFTFVGPFVATILITLISFIVGNYHSKSTPVLMFIFYLLTTICGNLVPCLESNGAKTLASFVFSVGSSAMVPYLQGVNLSGGSPSKKPFGVIIATAGGLFLGGIPAPFVYTKLLKTYPTEDVLRIFMRFLWLGAFFDFLMMVFKLMTYPKNPEKKQEAPAVELSEKA
jgi:hypothetical protein